MGLLLAACIKVIHAQVNIVMKWDGDVRVVYLPTVVTSAGVVRSSSGLFEWTTVISFPHRDTTFLNSTWLVQQGMESLTSQAKYFI